MKFFRIYDNDIVYLVFTIPLGTLSEVSAGNSLSTINILGDPSLQVYLDTPKQFTLTSNSITSTDNFVSITVLDPDSAPVKNAVISVMVEGQLIGKGISDDNGKYAASLDIAGTPVLDIYANKAGFIQGHEALSVQSSQARKSKKSI